MKIYCKKSLKDFAFWGVAEDNASQLTSAQLDEIEGILEDMRPDGMEEAEINGLFWFEFDTIKEWLGVESEE